MKFTKLFFALVLITVLFSCSTSNNVVSGNFIQKRKYTKGFYVEKNNSFGTSGKENQKTDKLDETNQKSNPQIVYTSPEIEEENEILINESTLEENDQVEETFPSYAGEEQMNTKDNIILDERKSSYETIRENFIESTILDESSQNNPEFEQLKPWLGILLCILGLAPFGVLLAFGPGKEFTVNFVFWLIAVLSVITGAILVFTVLSGVVSGAALGLYVLAFLCFFISFLHGMLKIIIRFIWNL